MVLMISLTGPTTTDEYRAAEALQQRIIAAWPACVTNPQQNITLVAAATCYGADRRDIDLLVFVDLLASPRAVPNGTQPTTLASCCLVIEIKHHPCDHVRFVGNRVEVQYHQHWHDVSEQNYRQVFALKDSLETQHVAAPFVTNLIWLCQVPERELPPGQHTIIGSDPMWDIILKRISQHVGSHGRLVTGRMTAGGNIAAAAHVFTTVRHPHATVMESQKITSLRQATASFPTATVPAYVTKLGTQVFVFQGRGGTGKTVSLLKLAHGLYIHRQARVLILTYNRALVADIRRLLTLLDVPDGVARGSIGVQTAHSLPIRYHSNFARTVSSALALALAII